MPHDSDMEMSIEETEQMLISLKELVKRRRAQSNEVIPVKKLRSDVVCCLNLKMLKSNLVYQENYKFKMFLFENK